MRQTEFFLKATDPKTLTVGQLMQDAVTRCTSRTDASTIAQLMNHRNYGSLPVVEEDGTLVGIVTEYDLLQAMLDGRDLRKLLATEIMSAHPLTVTEDQTLAQVADLFQDRYLTRCSSGAEQQTGGDSRTAGFALRLYEGVAVLVVVGC